MDIRRNYKYRIYPTLEQETILLRWEGILRMLWNLCHEQRLMGYNRPRDERIYPKNISKEQGLSQNKQMTELLEANPWIGEVQCQARQKTLENLDVAWQRVFLGLSETIRFKSKVDGMSIYIPANKDIGNPKLRGSKTAKKVSFETKKYKPLGALKIIVDRPILGTVKSWTLKREGKEWYATACTEQKMEVPATINNKVVGIDRGIVVPIADSDGRLTENPRLFEKFELPIRRAKRVVSRRKKGSKNRNKAKERVAKLERTKARQRALWTNTQSLYYVENYGKVIIEALNIENMTKSARGSKEKSGKKVKQKSGLNRAILDAGWGMFSSQLDYKLAERGGELVKVIPNGTSQTCPECGHCEAGNRPNRDTFLCLKCRHTEHADTAASKVIKQRGSDPTQVKKERPPKKLIKRYRRKKTDEDMTAVKPTAKQPEEGNPSSKGSYEPGTQDREVSPRSTRTSNSEDTS
jgi:putative transposase